jgi:hypothetical protein
MVLEVVRLLFGRHEWERLDMDVNRWLLGSWAVTVEDLWSTIANDIGHRSDGRVEKMTEPAGSGNFSELFEVITKYSQRDRDHQEKALRVIAGVYEVPLEVEAMPDAKQVVDDILGQHDYVFTVGGSGSLDPHSVDAVVRVALYSEKNREWGINRLSRILEGLVRKLNAEEDYPDYVEDTARVITGLQTVVSGSLAEEIAEDLKEIAEDAAGGA